MARKKSKSVNFDAMVKFFMQTYGVPTKKDVDKLMARMDRIETLIKSSTSKGGRKQTARAGKSAGPVAKRGKTVTASDTVLNIIKKSKNGIGFSAIQAKTGFPEKKLRNIIFRLNKLGNIKRKDRGIYTVAA